MLLVCVSGIQGAGKTKLIKELVVRMEGLGRRSAVIVNEDGEELYEESFIRSHLVALERLRGG